MTQKMTNDFQNKMYEEFNTPEMSELIKEMVVEAFGEYKPNEK